MDKLVVIFIAAMVFFLVAFGNAVYKERKAMVAQATACQQVGGQYIPMRGYGYCTSAPPKGYQP